MVITFDYAERIGDTSVAFYFRPEGRLRYTPGQFVEIHVPHAPMDTRGDRRIFTLTSEPGEALLSIAATLPEPGSSFKRTLRSLQPGAKAHIIGEPLGDFVLPKDPSIPLVWMAGGVASASFASMAKALAREGVARQVTFLQSARTPGDLIFGQLWHAAGIRPIQAVTRANPPHGARRTRFTPGDLLAAANGRASQTLFYISGSDQMVEEMCRGLMAHGIATEQLVREAYTGY